MKLIDFIHLDCQKIYPFCARISNLVVARDGEARVAFVAELHGETTKTVTLLLEYEGSENKFSLEKSKLVVIQNGASGIHLEFESMVAIYRMANPGKKSTDEYLVPINGEADECGVYHLNLDDAVPGVRLRVDVARNGFVKIFPGKSAINVYGTADDHYATFFHEGIFSSFRQFDGYMERIGPIPFTEAAFMEPKELGINVDLHEKGWQ